MTRSLATVACLLCAGALVMTVALAAPHGASGSPSNASASAGCVRASGLGVVFVLDDSGSMAETDPQDLRADATSAALGKMFDGSVAAASKFSDSATGVVPPTALTVANRTVFGKAVRDSLASSGGTNYQAAFLEAKRQLDLMASSEKKVVVFLSDGEPSSPYDADRPIAASGVPIYTVGFASAPPGELQAIAARSGGESFVVNSASAAEAKFASIVKTLNCGLEPPHGKCAHSRTGTPLSDRLVGSAANECIVGEAGDDIVDGKRGEDRVDAGAGNDVLVGGAGRDRLTAGAGDDLLNDGAGKNVFLGGSGDDEIYARQSVPESVDCGPGRDVAYVDSRDSTHGCEQVHFFGGPKADPNHPSAGPGGDRRALQETARIINPVTAYAPLLMVNPKEEDPPSDPADFIANSTLKFMQYGDCPNEALGHVSAAQIGEESFLVKPIVDVTCQPHSDGYYPPTALTRPRQKSPLWRDPSLPLSNGYYLDYGDDGKTTDSGHSAHPYDGGPIFYEITRNQAENKTLITYWFFNTFSQIYIRIKAGIGVTRFQGVPARFSHEGDWERYAVLLDGTKAIKSYFYQHNGKQTLDFPPTCPGSAIVYDCTHRLAFSALGSHATYPSAEQHRLDEGWLRKIIDTLHIAQPFTSVAPVDWTRYVSSGPNRVKTWKHLVCATEPVLAPWYGFGGAWGFATEQTHNPGDIAEYTGPLGPSVYKGREAGFVTGDCAQTDPGA